MTDFLTLQAATTNPMEAANILAQYNNIDLLLLDINMPDLDGLALAKKLNHKPIIIFTTAYPNYAIEGFKADALDYLLKPFSYTEFLRSAEKARRQYQLLNSNPTPQPTQLFVKSGYQMVKINVQQITHIESRSEYVRIYTTDNKPVMTLGSLKNIEDKLPLKQFMRIHRSYIVNLKHVTQVEKNIVIVTGNAKLHLGEQFKEQFKKYIADNMF
jgi:two-component system LytT family response regulator